MMMMMRRRCGMVPWSCWRMVCWSWRMVEERKRLEDDQSKLDEENRGQKRKEREWEEEKQRERDEILRKERHERKKKEREERKRQEREEKERLEKEKENLRVKEQMLIEKRKQKEEEKEKVEFENKVPLPISSPKKIGKSPEINHKSYQSPENCQNTKSSPEKECSEMNEVKTPKKLRKWPPENESPDPKKNFIKKHQEEQEKLHLESIANSPKPSLGPPTVPATPALAAPITKENQAPHSVQASKQEKGG